MSHNALQRLSTLRNAFQRFATPLDLFRFSGLFFFLHRIASHRIASHHIVLYLLLLFVKEDG
jgi:hypothetical protein